MADSASLLAVVRSYGSDATDPRDAAHEACHALQWGVRKPWTRDNIHAKKPRDRGFGVGDEITARAVEQIVCQRVGFDCGPVEKWAMVCWMETLKNERISLPTDSWLEDRIRERMGSKEAERMAERILALEPKPTRAPSPKRKAKKR